MENNPENIFFLRFCYLFIILIEKYLDLEDFRPQRHYTILPISHAHISQL